ncbi:expressed unknown protein [Seminavis robusta]|uniref:Sulfotransferase n=1 Tax=Seminavis robusta TaxID=568900 RepID=A0A9N8EK89_9STRA|nr:expressed unknown protein [Seminavis robusta]|eukprot:Sro1098_g241010.1 n/a (444) ;mRNA; r:27673-29004
MSVSTISSVTSTTTTSATRPRGQVKEADRVLKIPRTCFRLVIIYISAAISVFLVRINVTFRDTMDFAREVMVEDPNNIVGWRVMDSRSQLFNKKNDNMIVFVHPGKTGGTTIGSMLQVLCTSRTKADSREYCLNEWNDRHNNHNTTTSKTLVYPESQLSRSTRAFWHVNGYYPNQATVQHDASQYLISLRHPVERVISWFYYMHPINCHTVHGIPTPRQNYTLIDKACTTQRRIQRQQKQKQNDNREERFYNQCFPTIQQFAMAFHHKTTNTISQNCQQLAHETLQGYGGPNGMAGHLWANYSFYKSRMKPQTPILVVRTDQLWQDLQHIEQRLGGTGDVFAHQLELQQQQQSSSNNNNTTDYHKDPLSSEGYAALCCAMVNTEMKSHRELLQAATNLDAQQKQDTMQQVYQKCHPTLTSWSDLKRFCSSKKAPAAPQAQQQQ